MHNPFDLTNIDEAKHDLMWHVRDPSQAKGTVWSLAAAYAHCFSYSYEYLTLFIEQRNVNFGWYSDIKYYVPLPTPKIGEFLDILEFRRLELKRVLEGTTRDEKNDVEWNEWHWPKEWDVQWNYYGLVDRPIKELLRDTENAIRVQKFIYEKSRYDFEQVMFGRLVFDDRSNALTTIQSRISNAETLVLCDPYIFNFKLKNITTSEYIRILISIMPTCTLKKLDIFHGDYPVNHASEAERELRCQLNNTNIEINININKLLHDRVWIVNSDNAFVVGTSFNSIGDKLAFMLELPDSDLKEFIKHLWPIS
jgi:hypothetical protein